MPATVKFSLQVTGSSTTVTVEAGADLVENDPTFHTDVDQELFDKLPLESPSSSVSSLVTLSTPGIAADSNGLFHGLGDHAENSFSVDGQPITDQQSKVFSNQIPLDSIQSMEVISGAPPAEYGGKTSVVIVVTTRSGQGVTTPHGSVTTSYGSFGTSNVEADLAYGGQNWGNFISVSGLNSGRFLDPPEFVVMHDKGNEENLFDRVDFQLSTADSLHLNFGFTRSWFQTPNSFDVAIGDAVERSALSTTGGLDPEWQCRRAADQRSQIKTFNIAPSWTRVISQQHGLYSGRFCAAGRLQLLSQRQPVRRPWRAQLTKRNSESETHSYECRPPLGCLVREGHSQPEGGSHVRTDVSERDDPLGIVDPTLNAPVLMRPEVRYSLATPSPMTRRSAAGCDDNATRVCIRRRSLQCRIYLSAGLL